ncbi:MAG: RNase adapter RapZ [Wenzhouxiangella sp.]
MSRLCPIVIISGLSGSGKSVALNALEDKNYYCVDNLPGGLLADLLDEIRRQPERYPRVAIGIDARTGPDGLEKLQRLLESRQDDPDLKLLFLTAERPVLVRRFSETRRRHPLASVGGLDEAIRQEKTLMAPIRGLADWVIDTSETNIHQLRRQTWRQIGGASEDSPATLVLESFAFKKGVPRDAEMLFDARCLPNPYWEPDLRPRTGLDPDVQAYLGGNERVEALYADLLGMIQRWQPALFEDQRSLLTVAIGCTGGQHRSVYLVDRLGQALRDEGVAVVVNHRELDK